jgi:tRNA-dihydrouridine synthase
MGCSAPAITRTGAGVRWMESVDKATAMIAQVRRAVKKRLSVKLRTGLKDDFEYLVSFCRRLQAEGVELITLHPRTAKEKFRRTCRWNYVLALKKELKIPVVGNGDISSAEELIRRSKGCDAVMIGRLAVRKPWIFAQARALEAGSDKNPVPNPDIEETGLKFLELLAKYQPPEFYLSRARRFFSYFCDNLKWGNYLKNELNRQPDLSGIEKTWRKFFTEQTIQGCV